MSKKFFSKKELKQIKASSIEYPRTIHVARSRHHIARFEEKIKYRANIIHSITGMAASANDGYNEPATRITLTVYEKGKKIKHYNYLRQPTTTTIDRQSTAATDRSDSRLQTTYDDDD